jgi:hypothetical protein
VYKAVLTLTAKDGFTFTSLAADSFSYSGATLTNDAGNGTTITVTITFPATAALSPVTSITGTADDRQVMLNWTDPTETDLVSIEISWNGGGSPASVRKGTQTYTTAENLTNGTASIFTLTAVDAAGNRSAGVSSDAFTPRAPTGLVTVEFTDPQAQDEAITLSQTPEAISWHGKRP